MSVEKAEYRFIAKLIVFLALVGIVWGVFNASARAEAGPGWVITGRSYPAYIPPAGKAVIDLQIFNVGAADSQGPVTVTDTLPPGLEAIEAGDLEGNDAVLNNGTSIGHQLWVCTGKIVVKCAANLARMPHFAGGAGGSGGEGNHTNFTPQIAIEVRALPGAAEHELSHATVAGGGASTPASTTEPITISSAVPPFGFSEWDVWFSNENGTIDTQAGSHPYAATFSFTLNSVPLAESPRFTPAGGQVRNIEVRLPPGFVGNPNAVAQCTLREFEEKEVCKPESQIGFDDVALIGGALVFRFPVYNMVPPPGVSAEFAFAIAGVDTFLTSGVRSGSDYGITTDVDDTPEREIAANVLTLWGVPGDPSHNRWRNNSTEGCSPEEIGTGNCPTANGDQAPFLTLPTSCGGPQAFSIRANTWTDETYTQPVVDESHDSEGEPVGVTGCEHLGFAPSFTTDPDTSDADTPAGLTVEVNPPTGGLESAEGHSTADVQNTTVTLPEGMAINPGQAAGLQACQPWQDGLTTEAERAAGEEDNGPPSCPNASKVGTASIRTPLLESAAEKELLGNVYVLPSDPPELKLLLAASADGVNVKVVGTVHLNEQTGQLTTTFEQTPELPYSHLKLSFSGGAQAALATPTRCGLYTARSDFTPWASPFVADAFPSAQFAITSGTDGTSCPGPGALPYTPTMTAGSTTDQAGGFTDFSLLLQVPDDQQRTERLQFKTPEGLLGMISRVPLCTNAQAEANACPAASQIGHTVVASGPGPYPLQIPEPGQPPAPIYLTEGYEGAPYGLSIVVPVDVGPFTLPTQRVRARIEVNELTAQLTVTTNALPQYVAGVPTDLRTIDAVVDRPGFMFNPTGCEPQAFSGTAYGSEGAQAPIESHFQMGSCRALLFKPSFKAFTAGKTSRANGASLGVRIVYPTGELGANQASSQSNIKSVKVELPKKLPSRLTTLQKACTAAQFNTNPAGCPAASVVGHAKALTPVLPVPLEGPAYFVSNGNESFPNLIIVLQGYGVTVHLVGDTFISKTGITSSTFKQVPDVPIGSFELNLPEGPFSALAANGNLCKDKLKMPTHFVAQNGAELQQSTPVAVTGCPKARKATHRKKTKHRHVKRTSRKAGKHR
ncbi:MAG TPA: hypothetical protein VMU32_08555 [Solirubrobacteraceae bacterium]|nr:hypothetical protein [Solirubrobacteraceae bacterium]